MKCTVVRKKTVFGEISILGRRADAVEDDVVRLVRVRCRHRKKVVLKNVCLLFSFLPLWDERSPMKLGVLPDRTLRNLEPLNPPNSKFYAVQKRLSTDF